MILNPALRLEPEKRLSQPSDTELSIRTVESGLEKRTPGRIYAFGAFELDPRQMELRQAGASVELHATPLRLLTYLVREHGRTVPKGELLEEVWPGVVVSDASLSTALAEVRQVLGDDGRTQRWIRTRRGRGYRFVGAVEERRRTSEPSSVASLAVLPLENLSGDPDQEYFADGLTEALIGDLAKIGSLRVISRTSVMHYKGSRKTIPEIASELSVDKVIEGSFSRSGQRVRVSAQLIDANEDHHLWAATFDRDLGDVLSVQGEVAQAVAEQMQIELTPEVSRDLAETRETDSRAAEEFFKGEYLSAQQNAPFLFRAAEHFDRAIEIDPAYAPPHVERAFIHLWLAGSMMPAHEEMPQARAAALRALDLDQRQSGAHSALGWIHLQYDWDWDRAEASFRRCIELSPSSSDGYRGCAETLFSRGMHEEALRHAKRCLELGPLDPRTRVACASYLAPAGYPEQAYSECLAVLEVAPHLGNAWFGLAGPCLLMGRTGEALDALVRGLEAHGAPEELLQRVRGESDLGGAARTLAASCQKPGDFLYLAPANISEWCAVGGEVDQAFDLLERAFRERATGLHRLRASPHWRSLHDDPRFEDLCRRIGIPGG